NLRAAGAVVIGRTNVPAFSMQAFSENDLHGRTLNPRNREVTPGGSSGGAGAAVAAGIGPIAQGNDIAGSVRFPAYCCGIVGLRVGLGAFPHLITQQKSPASKSATLRKSSRRRTWWLIAGLGDAQAVGGVPKAPLDRGGMEGAQRGEGRQ